MNFDLEGQIGFWRSKGSQFRKLDLFLEPVRRNRESVPFLLVGSRIFFFKESDILTDSFNIRSRKIVRSRESEIFLKESRVGTQESENFLTESRSRKIF